MNSIRKIVIETLKEAFSGGHSLDRLSERFIDRENLQVGYEKEGSVGEYKTIGTYNLSDGEKESIKKKYKFIEDYKFPEDEDFGIRLTYIKINPDEINYYSEEDKVDSLGKNLLFVDEKTNSNGNEIYVIIRRNEIQTIYFAKNYIQQTKEKLRVDRIVKNELFFTKLNGEKPNPKGGSRKKVELDLPKVKIGGKDWYVDEPNEELIYSKNIKKKISFDRLSEKQFEELIEFI
tara:strand:- start:1012 stop:1710 length:699 start_codon:yes stop_codon:yes gene_type:complete